MTYQKAKEASKHNPAGVMKVLERLVWDCPECGGTGYEKEMEPLHEIQKDMDRDGPMEKCDECDDGKVKYHWSPQVGEWVVYKEDIALVVRYWPKTASNKFESVEVSFKGQWGEDKFGTLGIEEMVSEFTPILPWETIEEILEKAGYYFEEPIKRVYGSEGSKYHCVIKKLGNPKPAGVAWGNSRQEAVMKAVLALGKELKC